MRLVHNLLRLEGEVLFEDLVKGQARRTDLETTGLGTRAVFSLGLEYKAIDCDVVLLEVLQVEIINAVLEAEKSVYHRLKSIDQIGVFTVVVVEIYA